MLTIYRNYVSLLSWLVGRIRLCLLLLRIRLRLPCWSVRLDCFFGLIESVYTNSIVSTHFFIDDDIFFDVYIVLDDLYIVVRCWFIEPNTHSKKRRFTFLVVVVVVVVVFVCVRAISTDVSYFVTPVALTLINVIAHVRTILWFVSLDTTLLTVTFKFLPGLLSAYRGLGSYRRNDLY